jgi:hypothetical protein
MKKNYFILFLCFAVLGLIFAFENIATNTRVLILFKVVAQSLFYTITLSTLVGIIAGFFLGLSITSKEKSANTGGSDIDL